MGETRLLVGVALVASLPGGACQTALDATPDVTIVGMAVACGAALLIIAAFFALVAVAACGGYDKWQRLRGRVKIPKHVYKMRKLQQKMSHSAANSEVGLIPNGGGGVAPDVDILSGNARVDMWNERNKPYEKPYAEIGQTITLDDEVDDIAPPDDMDPSGPGSVQATSYVNRAFQDDTEVRIEAEIVEGETLDLGPFHNANAASDLDNAMYSVVNRDRTSSARAASSPVAASSLPLASQEPEDLYAVVDKDKSRPQSGHFPKATGADDGAPVPGYLDPENIFLNQEIDSSVYLF